MTKIITALFFLVGFFSPASANGAVIIPFPTTFTGDVIATILVFASAILAVLVVRECWLIVSSMIGVDSPAAYYLGLSDFSDSDSHEAFERAQELLAAEDDSDEASLIKGERKLGHFNEIED